MKKLRAFKARCADYPDMVATANDAIPPLYEKAWTHLQTNLVDNAEVRDTFKDLFDWLQTNDTSTVPVRFNGTSNSEITEIDSNWKLADGGVCETPYVGSDQYNPVTHGEDIEKLIRTNQIRLVNCPKVTCAAYIMPAIENSTRGLHKTIKNGFEGMLLYETVKFTSEREGGGKEETSPETEPSLSLDYQTEANGCFTNMQLNVGQCQGSIALDFPMTFTLNVPGRPPLDLGEMMGASPQQFFAEDIQQRCELPVRQAFGNTQHAFQNLWPETSLQWEKARPEWDRTIAYALLLDEWQFQGHPSPFAEPGSTIRSDLMYVIQQLSSSSVWTDPGLTAMIQRMIDKGPDEAHSELSRLISRLESQVQLDVQAVRTGYMETFHPASAEP